ncbi:MAG TPA: transporter [Pseudolabrys sp.]|nr:transporter [Pseudolabrys sp.]
MIWVSTRKNCALGAIVTTCFAATSALYPTAAPADENGISFWLPGIYGSLAAAPLNPGLSLATVYYHTSVSADGATAASREIAIGRLNPTTSVNLNVNLHVDVDLALINPNYVFATPVLGGQFALGFATFIGHNSTSLDGILTAMAGPVVTTSAGSIDSSVSGFGDLFPQASLRWNQGVNSFMAYLTGDIPVGAYDSTRLANLGIGHGAVDGGVGYTYLDPQTGRELSIVTGLTYNFKNYSTDYQSGIDWHLDWGASQFLSKQFFVGAVGYLYDQITADSGAAAFLGSNESRVAAVGPQIGYIFPLGEYQGFLGAKSYFEFGASRRPEGWNSWLTFVISPGAQPAPPNSMLPRK